MASDLQNESEIEMESEIMIHLKIKNDVELMHLLQHAKAHDQMVQRKKKGQLRNGRPLSGIQ